LALGVEAQGHMAYAVASAVKLDEGLPAIEVRAILTQDLCHCAWIF